MGNNISLELTAVTFSIICHALEEYTVNLTNYADIAGMVSIIDILYNAYDDNSKEICEDIQKTVDDQNFHKYLIEHIEDDKCKKLIENLYKDYCMKE